MAIETLTAAELVSQDPRWIRVFEQYHIDYCCKGDSPLGQLCQQRGIAIEQLLQAFQSIALQPPGSLLHVQFWDLPLVVDFILQNHHRFARAALDELAQLLPTVLKHHRERLPVLVSLWEIFQRIDREFRAHLEREEQWVFPFVQSGELEKIPPQILDALRSEHDLEAAEFERLRTLTRDFQPPPIECRKTQRTYDLLRHLYFDLHQHAFLENHVLFPRLEQALQQQHSGEA